MNTVLDSIGLGVLSLEDTYRDDSSRKRTELHKQACRCFRGLNRSLIACETCQRYDRALTRLAVTGGRLC